VEPQALERAADEAGEDEVLGRPGLVEIERSVAAGRDPTRAILRNLVPELLRRLGHALSSHPVEET
jgi:hypothetical protein